MKLLKFFPILFLLSLIACQEYQLEESEVLEQEVGNNKRMAFNQDVYFLNSANGKSEIFDVDFDFQGLTGHADLTKLELTKDGVPFELPNGGHMCVSPDNRFLTVVVAKQSKIFLVEISSGIVKEATLMAYDLNKTSISTVLADPEKYKMQNLKNAKGKKIGGITQVDVDKEGYLFIAGKAGFFRVVADRGNGEKDPSEVNYGKDIWSEIWAQQDLAYLQRNNVDTDTHGSNWVHAIHYQFSGSVAVESSEDEFEEEYFEEVDTFNPKKVKFRGGDILFTQNSAETDGFEQQRLISFSQWKGGTAIYLDLHWDWKNEQIYFDAGRVMEGLNMNRNNESGKGAGRVTGAALTGDNMVFTSHHFSNYLQLRTLDGTVIRDDIELRIDGDENNLLRHNWGDMASTQQFDKNSQNPVAGGSSKEIDGEYYNAWYRGEEIGHQYAEVKLYRPEKKVYDINELSNTEASYNATKDSRGNSANADLADYRKNAEKFVSLGGDGGYVLMQLQMPITVSKQSMLQVVETSWNKASDYTPTSAGWNSYKESAEVYVLEGNTSKYYDPTEMDPNNSNWTSVGVAYIANNEFKLSEAIDLGTDIRWIMVKDSGSKTSDGFDVNFVSSYEAQPEILINQTDYTWLPCDITVDSYAIRSGDDNPSNKVRGGEAMYKIPDADDIVASSIIQLTQAQMDELGTKSGRSRVIGLFTAEIDGKLHAYEIHDDCAVKGMRHFEWGGENKNASFVPLPLKADKYDMSQVTTSFVDWDGFDIIYNLNGETKRVPFAQKQEARLRYKKAIDYVKVLTLWGDIIPKLSICGDKGDIIEVDSKYHWDQNRFTSDKVYISSMSKDLNTNNPITTDVFQILNGYSYDIKVDLNIDGEILEIEVPANTWIMGKGVFNANLKGYTIYRKSNNEEISNKGQFGTFGSTQMLEYECSSL
ncbi:hypothetical protein [Sediminitomix flava]|uniref:Uncharacterized protein n=1 Tax=Sediminitomix flava TaxID=379075 RepID=A0A315ZFU9_SEDFL|nr:hypothetical protein [Sediminitomix flava]PWJ44391.1 hypothetical protein BC781_101750 [Sediminitomix flava]